MKDAQFKAIRDYCKPIALKWLGLMYCGWDKVDLNWSDHYFDREHDGHPRECVAFCVADWRYMHATITFSCARLWDHWNETTMLPEDPEFIEYLIIHEIGHVLINEMREWDGSKPETMGHEERVVSRMAKAFQYTFKQGMDAGERRVRDGNQL